MRGSGKRDGRFWRGAATRALVLWLAAVSAALGAAVPEQTVSGLVGVVTYSEPSSAVLYVQTTSAGIRISLPDGSVAPSIGARVRIDGKTVQSNGPVVIDADSVRVVGSKPIPAPIPMRADIASAGMQLGRFVEVTCVVHAATVSNGAIDLSLETDDSDFEAHVLAPGLGAVPDRLVDARVRVRAVCGPRFNKDGHLTGYHLLAPSVENVVVVDPGPSDPFAAPTRQISSLLHGSPSDDDRRIHIAGVVTLQRPGDAVFLQDETGGIYISTDQPGTIAPGDRIDVLGYLTTVDSFPSLYDAEVRVSKRGVSVPAVRLAPPDVLAGSFDSRLVAVDGTLDTHSISDEGGQLTLEDGGNIFIVRLRDVVGPKPLAALGDGSRLRITGVCAVRVDADKAPTSFVIYPRDLADIVVLRAPPYWNFDRLLWILAAVLAVAAIVVAWVVVLRRRVRRQTDVIRRQVESETALDRRYRDLVERATDVIYTRTRAGALVSVNASGESVSGYPREELLRMRVRDLVVPSGRRPRARRGESATFELEIARKDGEHRILEVREHALEGEPGVLLGIARDVTEPRRLSGQLQQAQRMECVGRLAGGVAHDFNNLLTVISGYGALALDALEAGRQPVNELRAVLTAGERAATLTSHLLAFSRKQVFRVRPLDLNETLAHTGPMLGRLIGEDVVVDLRPGNEIGTVSADAGQIEQVLLNLVVNARDAMPNGGRLTVETGSAFVDEAHASRHADARSGAFVTLSVCDTGTGIDPDLVERIFDPFFTTKAVGKGTGLGLSTVYGVVTQSGGWIEVESEIGFGTKFVVFLPRVDAVPAASEEKPADDEMPRGSETILVVEDEPTVRALAARVLRACGYTVVDAESGEEALAIYDGAGGSIDLVITDVIMPGMNGGEVAAALAERSPAPRVLFMSGYTDDVIGRHGILEDGLDFVAKPFTPGALARKSREILDRVAV